MFKYFYTAHDETRKVDVIVYSYSEENAFEKAQKAIKLPLWRLNMIVEVFKDIEWK